MDGVRESGNSVMSVRPYAAAADDDLPIADRFMLFSALDGFMPFSRALDGFMPFARA